MSLAQDFKKYDNRPVIKLPENLSDEDIKAAYSDCIYLTQYLSWILSGNTPLPQFGTYFASRNEFLEPNVVFTKNIFSYLKRFNPQAPENKEITHNLTEINDFFQTGKNMEIFKILPRKFNLRINIESALAQAITQPQIRFDKTNEYRRIWTQVLQECFPSQNDERSR